MVQPCDQRAQQGYNSGMGTIFRLAAGINPIVVGLVTTPPVEAASVETNPVEAAINETAPEEIAPKEAAPEEIAQPAPAPAEITPRDTADQQDLTSNVGK